MSSGRTAPVEPIKDAHERRAIRRAGVETALTMHDNAAGGADAHELVAGVLADKIAGPYRAEHVKLIERFLERPVTPRIVDHVDKVDSFALAERVDTVEAGNR